MKRTQTLVKGVCVFLCLFAASAGAQEISWTYIIGAFPKKVQMASAFCQLNCPFGMWGDQHCETCVCRPGYEEKGDVCCPLPKGPSCEQGYYDVEEKCPAYELISCDEDMYCLDGVCHNKCDENEHYDNGLCCPYAQKNIGGICTCESAQNNCGRACCNGVGEVCRDAEKGICCAAELCNGACCPDGSVCQNGICTNPCQSGEHLINYYDISGVRHQTCYPSNVEGADASGTCCEPGFVGAFGHNHQWQYISKCCPKAGQEDKGMIGLRGLAETYSCAPPDTTMLASAEPNESVGHTWYVPRGSVNVLGVGWACAPGTRENSGVLHNGCGSVGSVCQHGWIMGRDCHYCYGFVDNENRCILPNCTLPRQHLAYCYCNPANGSYYEDVNQGGTGPYPIVDVCVTPQ